MTTQTSWTGFLVSTGSGEKGADWLIQGSPATDWFYAQPRPIVLRCPWTRSWKKVVKTGKGKNLISWCLTSLILQDMKITTAPLASRHQKNTNIDQPWPSTSQWYVSSHQMSGRCPKSFKSCLVTTSFRPGQSQSWNIPWNVQKITNCAYLSIGFTPFHFDTEFQAGIKIL